MGEVPMLRFAEGKDREGRQSSVLEDTDGTVLKCIEGSKGGKRGKMKNTSSGAPIITAFTNSRDDEKKT